MSYIEEQLLREHLREAHRQARTVRTLRVLRARRRAEVAARRAVRLTAVADDLARRAQLVDAAV